MKNSDGPDHTKLEAGADWTLGRGVMCRHLMGILRQEKRQSLEGYYSNFDGGILFANPSTVCVVLLACTHIQQARKLTRVMPERVDEPLPVEAIGATVVEFVVSRYRYIGLGEP
jgi:hypothetical protein